MFIPHDRLVHMSPTPAYPTVSPVKSTALKESVGIVWLIY